MTNYADDDAFENFNVDDLAAELDNEDSGEMPIPMKPMKQEEKPSQEAEQKENNDGLHEDDDGKTDDKEASKAANVADEGTLTHPIFALKCTANREETVADFLAANAKRKNLGVYSIIVPAGIKNFIFVEAENKYEVDQAAYRVPYARNALQVPISEKEALHLISTDKKEFDFRKNDTVEIIAGPFKKERARITRIDSLKEEIVLELLDAAVPIPMTRKMDDIKLVRRDE